MAAADSMDPTIDLFALAVIVHEALTGVHPFGDEMACRGEPTIDPSVEGRLGEALARAMAPEPERRFPSATEFREAMAALVQGIATLPQQNRQQFQAEVDNEAQIDITRANDEDIARMKRHYYGNISTVDEKLGEVLDALEERGWLEDSVLVFCSTTVSYWAITIWFTSG